MARRKQPKIYFCTTCKNPIEGNPPFAIIDQNGLSQFCNKECQDTYIQIDNLKEY